MECARSERERAATGIWIVSENTGPVCINKVLSKQRKFYSELITSAHFLYDQSETIQSVNPSFLCLTACNESESHMFASAERETPRRGPIHLLWVLIMITIASTTATAWGGHAI